MAGKVGTASGETFPVSPEVLNGPLAGLFGGPMRTIVQTETNRLHRTNDENFEIAAALTGGRDLQLAPAKTAVTRDRHGDITAELSYYPVNTGQ